MVTRELLKRLTPLFMRRWANWFLRRLCTVPRGIYILLSGSPLGKGIRVYYGLDRIPLPADETHGGIVKFLWMQDEFPNSPRFFNILYMVSSRIPYGGEHLAWYVKKKGKRVVWNQNGVAYPGWHGPGWEETNAPMSKVLHMADYVFYQSTFCQQSADRYLGPRLGAWEILYNAVDTEAFTPAPSDPYPNGLVLLLGGTQYQMYRLTTAIEVLARLVREYYVDARLLITGRLCWTSDEDEARRIAHSLIVRLGVEDRVEFLGAYSPREAPSIFRRAHLLLHTKYNDPCPAVVVEAMACGLPVVFSQSGGVPELVGNDAGVGVPADLCWERDIPPDPEKMAQAVLEVAKNRAKFAQVARDRAVEKFDLRPWLQRHREIFKGLLEWSGDHTAR